MDENLKRTISKKLSNYIDNHMDDFLNIKTRNGDVTILISFDYDSIVEEISDDIDSEIAEVKKESYDEGYSAAEDHYTN